MIARKNSKTALGSSPHAPAIFSGQIWLRSIVLAPEVIKWKIDVFHGDGFSSVTILIWEIRKSKWHYRVHCSPRQAGSKHVLFKVERSIWKFDPRSGQVMVRSTSDHDLSRSVCTSFEAARQAKPLGTICASLSPSCRDLLAKNGLWSHLTSGDLSVTPIVSCTQICTDGASGHDPERIGWFWLVYVKREAFSYFPLGL